jgi:puromycin-sensitive aminopeptidase
MKVPRLIADVLPAYYRIDLDIDMGQFVTSGKEVVQFELLKPSRQIVFHAASLVITEAYLDVENKAEAIRVSEPDQTATFVFEQEIPRGAHELTISFTGQVNDSLHGLYRSQYGHTNEPKWLATTQFEAVHAREAFVCIDEPSAKAIFEISLTVPHDMTAISNAPVASEGAAQFGYKTVSFQPTLKMSTYLIAFMVGEFEFIEHVTSDGTIIRTYATPGVTGQLTFALDTAVKILAYFNEYFDIPYPWTKLDLIAIPDFAAGAMENWAAITFRETALLLDPARASLANKQRVALVVAHELAHQWFGDLVTMSWWDDLWLNEGFASWVETLALDKLWPEWQPWIMFIESDTARAEILDSLQHTHPIQVEVDDPKGIDEIFDAISYSKGASVINMLHHYVGPEVFRDGLRAYLKRHQYGNSTTKDLWLAIEQVSGKPVVKVMSAWTSQPGYPLVSIEGQLVRQQRFYRSRPTKAANDVKSGLWPVPFNVVTDLGRETLVRINSTQTSTIPDDLTQAQWIKPNPGQTGFYRTHYSPEMISRLMPPIEQRKLGASDRFGVVSDVFATIEAGLTPSTLGLELLEAMIREDNFVAWSGVSRALSTLMAMTSDDKVWNALEKFAGYLVAPNARRLGWDPKPGEVPFDTLMRSAVLTQAVRYGDQPITQKALVRFAEYVRGGQLDPDVRNVVLYSAARHGSASDFEMMLDHYRSETSPQVKISLLSALGQFQDADLISRYLEFGLSPEVRPQDIYIIVATAFGNRLARELAWTWVKEHWGEFIRRYGAGGHMLERFPLVVASAFATRSMAAEFESFFSTRMHPAIKRPVAQALESIEVKASWYLRDGKSIALYLENRKLRCDK